MNASSLSKTRIGGTATHIPDYPQLKERAQALGYTLTHEGVVAPAVLKVVVPGGRIPAMFTDQQGVEMFLFLVEFYKKSGSTENEEALK